MTLPVVSILSGGQKGMAAIVRCKIHAVPESPYVFVSEPASGYPNTQITCGKRGCTNCGLVFLNVIDAREYRSGVRTFPLAFGPVKKVTLADGGKFPSEISK